MTPAELARAWARRVRVEARRPVEEHTPVEELWRQLVAELQAKALEDFSRVLGGPGPQYDGDDQVTPPAGTQLIPQAATQTPAGAPPSVLPTEGT